VAAGMTRSAFTSTMPTTLMQAMTGEGEQHIMNGQEPRDVDPGRVCAVWIERREEEATAAARPHDGDHDRDDGDRRQAPPADRQDASHGRGARQRTGLAQLAVLCGICAVTGVDRAQRAPTATTMPSLCRQALIGLRCLALQPVADYESEGRGFDSLRAHQSFQPLSPPRRRARFESVR
jgi:hypothetical protein